MANAFIQEIERVHLRAAALTETDAAAYISMSRSFLRRSRMEGAREHHAPAPPFVKVGRSIRYLRVDLDAWLQRFRVEIKKFPGG